MDDLNDKTRIEFYLVSWPNVKNEYYFGKHGLILLREFLLTILPAGTVIKVVNSTGSFSIIFNTAEDALAFTLKWK